MRKHTACVLFIVILIFTTPPVFSQHHGGQQAPPISFGDRKVTVNTTVVPTDFNPESNSSAELNIRFFDTSTNSNIENVSYRIQIFYGSLLVANQMFFDKDGELQIKVQPKSDCEQEELWKCTVYHGEKDPIVPNALTSSPLSKPVIIGPVFDKSGEYTVKTSIIGATNPRTQTETDIDFETKIIIPSVEKFSVLIDGKPYPVTIKSFNEKVTNFEYDDMTKNLHVEITFDWSHLEHIDIVKIAIEIPKDFPPLVGTTNLLVKVNDSQVLSNVVHFDDVSKKDANIIHLMLSKNDLRKIVQNHILQFSFFSDSETSIAKKEIIFPNGFKALISHNTKHNSELFFNISFLDENQNLASNVRYGYSLKDPSGNEVIETGSNPKLLGIELANGAESRVIKTPVPGSYEMQLVLIGTGSNDFPKYMYQKYNFELVDTVSKDLTNLDIPIWVKNNAGWWADGQIDDNSFIQGIQFLIKEGLVNLD